MRVLFSAFLTVSMVVFIAGCATVGDQYKKVTVSAPDAVEAKSRISDPGKGRKRYKRKIAILRFSNETNYGRALLSSEDYERVGKQTSDMLAAKLVESNQFLVFERGDLSKLKEERAQSGVKSELVGVETVIAGSLTEFGRSIDGKSGFLSSTKLQSAHAKVEARLVDIATGQAFFSAKGVGQASTESGEVAGFGSRSEYDSTLNDRAIGAAISDLLSNMVNRLTEKPWRTDILDIQGDSVFISGGRSQGLEVGDVLRVVRAGKKVRSGQNGFEISLPPTEVARLKVLSLFGESETNEGAVCQFVSPPKSRIDSKLMYVSELE